jgi:coenzyme PQQ precursor peptide PqqA
MAVRFTDGGLRQLLPAGYTKTRLSGALGANVMAWTTPSLVEICVGLEINGYLPAEF